MREVGAIVFAVIIFWINYKLRTNHIHELTEPALRLAQKLSK